MIKLSDNVFEELTQKQKNKIKKKQRHKQHNDDIVKNMIRNRYSELRHRDTHHTAYPVVRRPVVRRPIVVNRPVKTDHNLLYIIIGLIIISIIIIIIVKI